MNAWSGMDRRKFPRVQYPCLVVIRGDQEEKDVILTHTENIGVGGACVILKRNIKLFSPVEIELDLLDMGMHVKCQGKVVWSILRKMEEEKKPLCYDIGIEFVNLTDRDRQRIDEIAKRLVKQGEGAPSFK